MCTWNKNKNIISYSRFTPEYTKKITPEKIKKITSTSAI